MEKINVYIDGPNILGAVKETLGRRVWVDPFLLSRRLINPKTQKIALTYYSETPYSGSVFSSKNFQKQQSFFGHLHKYVKGGSIIKLEGNYRYDRITVPPFLLNGLAEDVKKIVQSLSWKKPIEKGGDVGLAVRLVRDAFQGAFDHAFVLTEDQDFAPAINIAMSNGKKVSICYINNFSRNAKALTNLCSAAKFLQITRKDFEACEV
jgi:uncharacterized LabA/DUF88 family protein